jgi:hypothetical protein
MQERYGLRLAVLLMVASWLFGAGNGLADTLPHDGVHHRRAQAPHDLAQPGSPVDQMEFEEGRRYSLLMHRSSGLVVVAVGILLLVDRLTGRRYRGVRIGIGLLWLLLGLHIMVNSDLPQWPLGAGFVESFSIPGANEWLQHKTLALLPLGLGSYVIVSRPGHPTLLQCSSAAGLLALGAIGLFFHEHLHEPGMNMELIDRQHHFMALTSLYIAGATLADGLDRFPARAKLFLLPVGLIVLGLQLAFYSE